VKDMQGNELVVGDAVHCKVGSEWIVGTILKIQNGGLAVAGVPPKGNHNNQNVGVTPDAIVLEVGIGFASQPGIAPSWSVEVGKRSRATDC
jgi:hypothetical protein